jgi:hypothetical protein
MAFYVFWAKIENIPMAANDMIASIWVDAGALDGKNWTKIIQIIPRDTVMIKVKSKVSLKP